MIFYYVLGVIIAYLLGSIPSAVWIGKYFYGIDVRNYGSGNSGATNTLRVLGKKAGIIVLLLDVLKGVAAVSLVYLLSDFQPGTYQFVDFQVILGGAAVLGHIFPIFANFKGGKGIATLFGVVMSIFPLAALISMGVFLLIFIIFRYVSLSSISAAITFPINTIFILKAGFLSLGIFSIAIAILVPLTHQKNIDRLIKGKENKLRFSKIERVAIVQRQEMFETNESADSGSKS